MDKEDADKILEGEIIEDAQENSLPLPAAKAPVPNAPVIGGWMNLIATIGGGIVKWLASSSRTTPFGGEDKPGQGGGGGRMRRRRGGGR